MGQPAWILGSGRAGSVKEGLSASRRHHAREPELLAQRGVLLGDAEQREDREAASLPAASKPVAFSATTARADHVEVPREERRRPVRGELGAVEVGADVPGCCTSQ